MSERSNTSRTPWLAACALATLMISLPACSHRLPGSGSAPLPPGWDDDRPGQAVGGAQDAEPLWGVPAFEPPTATDCRGPLRMRETPGQRPILSRRWPGAPATRGRDEALAASSEAADEAAAPAASGAREVLDRDSRKAAQHLAAAPQPQRGSLAASVSAGLVDDNADFGSYLDFVRRTARLNPRSRDATERYRLELRDAASRPVADAQVALSWPGARQARLVARTDAAGQVWLMPGMLIAPEELAALDRLEVQARASNGEVTRAMLQRSQKAAVQLQLRRAAPRPSRVPLDLVFLVDATGSMADEIAKLRDSLQSIADRVGALPTRPDLCWGLVAYRDRRDAFVTRTQDLTKDLSAFQRTLGALQAEGGGDYPEALEEALDEAVHRIAWRGDATTRLVVLLADAPPHLDRGGPHFDASAAVAVARGIKLHAVAASGLDTRGEAVFRQLAQTTGGRFVFLTYRRADDPSSGPGHETSHDVRDYSVDTLDELIVRLVRDELAARGR